MNGLQLTLDGISESDLISKQIKENQKLFDFDIKEYTIEFLVLKFDPNNDTHDIFIPDYQRDFVWTKKQQALFIESVLIGLPIPYIFVADIDEDEKEDADGRIEVVDGAQRIQTIDAYVNNRLKLIGLEKLPALEGLYFRDLPLINQRRFLRTSIRMIELKRIDEDGRRLMFDRLNTGGTKLSDMEKRFGSTNSKTLILIKDLAKDELYVEMTPMSLTKSSRREREEYALRFFAYRKNYQNFGANNSNSVIDFIDQFIKENDEIFNDKIEQEMQETFREMLIFVNNNFAYGFRKSQNSKSVSRIRFEATSVGSSLALEENPNIHPLTTEWAYRDEEFLNMMRSDASNSRPKIVGRIEFVKNKILGQDFNNHANQ